MMNNKPTWVIGLAQKGMGKGWTRRPAIQRASRSTPANSATQHTTPNSFQERSRVRIGRALQPFPRSVWKGGKTVKPYLSLPYHHGPAQRPRRGEPRLL